MITAGTSTSGGNNVGSGSGTTRVALRSIVSTLQPRPQRAPGDRRPRSISVIRRRRCPYTSSARLDELDVRLADGSHVALVLKDLSRRRMLHTARKVRPRFLYDPRREINAYRWILPHAPPGVPTCYGFVSDVRSGRHWLLLERVSGLQLTHVGEFTTWLRTAAWAARFHCTFSPQRARRLARRSSALVYDEAFYWHWLERAQSLCRENRRRQRVVQRIARAYPWIVDQLLRMPQTIIHGELYPANVVVSRTGSHERICPVDWELAALGPALVDLAALMTGWTPDKQRRLARAYFAATYQQGCGSHDALLARLPRTFVEDVSLCRLHVALRMLAWAEDWRPPEEHVTDWVAEAAQVADTLQF